MVRIAEPTTNALKSSHVWQNFGHELRRPTADLLEEGIYELRVGVGQVNYRILYFFHGRQLAILAHGLTKERAIPRTDLKTAIARKIKFQSKPDRHTHRE
jgi:phage-related protein